MDDAIIFTNLNDFIFCPASIYFHNLYEGTDIVLYQTEYQLNGTAAHKTIDEGVYSTRQEIITGLDVYSERYNLTGKIDAYNMKDKTLVERKKRIKTIYDGYVLYWLSCQDKISNIF